MHNKLIKEAVKPENLTSGYSGSYWGNVSRRIGKNRAAVAGLIIFILICLACLFAPLLTKWDYSSINKNIVNEGPSHEHILGTDNLGRDMLARLLYGGRITLGIALTSTVIAAAVGSAIGLISGYFGGKADFFVSHLLDFLAAVPLFLLIIVTEFALGVGRGYFMYAMALGAVPQFARLVRVSTMNIIGSRYIEAARALGMSHFRIIHRHVLHNVFPTLIVRFTTGVTEALLICTILGYLSIGIASPMPEWGALVYSGKSYIRMQPSLMILPCVAIISCVISLSLFGDGLRDTLDPRG